MTVPPDAQDATKRDGLETGLAAPEPITPRDPTVTPPASAASVSPPTSPEPPASRFARALRRGRLLAHLRQTAAPPAPTRGEQPAETGSGGGAKAKVTALVRGAAALANKVRRAVTGRGAAGGRVVAGRARTIREKRLARRCVIVTESGGRPVVIGPYRDEQAARQDAARVPGDAQVAQLKSGAAYFAEADSGPTTAPS
jgi:hypothetical protein